MEVNDLYYNKYLKYKNKYINLQSQIGGDGITASGVQFLDEEKKNAIQVINDMKVYYDTLNEKSIQNQLEKIINEQNTKQIQIINEILWYNIVNNINLSLTDKEIYSQMRTKVLLTHKYYIEKNIINN